MASLSEIAKKNGVITKKAEPAKKEKFGKRRPWSLGDDESSEFNQEDREYFGIDGQQVANAYEGLEEHPGTSTGSKLETKLGQTGDKVRTKTQDKLETKSGQTEDTKNNLGQKLETKLRTQHRTKLGQTKDKLRTKHLPFSACVGVQRRLLLFLFEACQSASGRQTDKISLECLCEACKITPHTARKSTQRLEMKNLLRRIEFKNGRSGWTRYELPDEVFQDILREAVEDKLRTKLGQTEDKLETKLETKLRTNPSSSSSYINNNFKPTTTAETRACEEDVWSPEDVDYSMLTEIGFGRSQVLQLRSLGIPFDVVQRSLVYFEFEYRHTPSGKTIQEPLGLLMKRMRQNGCWEAPEEYEKRRAHFRGRFEEGEQQVLAKAHRVGATNDTDNENFETP